METRERDVEARTRKILSLDLKIRDGNVGGEQTIRNHGSAE
jgi:hypothetical protein